MGNKKNQSKIIEINTMLPLFNIPIQFYIVTNKNKFIQIVANQLMEKYGCQLEYQNCEGFFLELDGNDNEHHFIIALPSTSDGKVDISTLVHEICHTGLAIKKYLGITTSDEFDECLAYFMGGIITQFCKVSNINNYLKLPTKNIQETTNNE